MDCQCCPLGTSCSSTTVINSAPGCDQYSCQTAANLLQLCTNHTAPLYISGSPSNFPMQFTFTAPSNQCTPMTLTSGYSSVTVSMLGSITCGTPSTWQLQLYAGSTCTGVSIGSTSSAAAGGATTDYSLHIYACSPLITTQALASLFSPVNSIIVDCPVATAADNGVPLTSPKVIIPVSIVGAIIVLGCIIALVFAARSYYNKRKPALPHSTYSDGSEMQIQRNPIQAVIVAN
jgi:hypothetical protein